MAHHFGAGVLEMLGTGDKMLLFGPHDMEIFGDGWLKMNDVLISNDAWTEEAKARLAHSTQWIGARWVGGSHPRGDWRWREEFGTMMTDAEYVRRKEQQEEGAKDSRQTGGSVALTPFQRTDAIRGDVAELQ